MRAPERRSHLFQGGQVQVHGPRADGATARHGHPGFAHAGQQRPQAQYRGPHGLDQIVRSFGAQRAGLHPYPARLESGRAAQDVQQLEGCVNIPQIGNIGIRDGFFKQNGGHKDGQGGVFRAADGDRAAQGAAAFDNQIVHAGVLADRG